MRFWGCGLWAHQRMPQVSVECISRPSNLWCPRDVLFTQPPARATKLLVPTPQGRRPPLSSEGGICPCDKVRLAGPDSIQSFPLVCAAYQPCRTAFSELILRVRRTFAQALSLREFFKATVQVWAHASGG